LLVVLGLLGLQFGQLLRSGAQSGQVSRNTADAAPTV
jgi:hypothetical protein